MPKKSAWTRWIKKFECSLLLHRQIFTNGDRSTSMLYLICSDLQCTAAEIETIYKKRCNVEIFNKTIKSNTALEKSPTKTLLTQENNVFMSIYSAFNLECLSVKHHLNHFSLKAKLSAEAIKYAFCETKRPTSCIAAPASDINQVNG